MFFQEGNERTPIAQTVGYHIQVRLVHGSSDSVCDADEILR